MHTLRVVGGDLDGHPDGGVTVGRGLVSRPGLEPGTYGLKVRCSTC